jgi:uncharacterized protein YndB with AHSA1/START domain
MIVFLRMSAALLGWIYVAIGLSSSIQWFYWSALIAGAAAIIIHLIELPFAFKRDSETRTELIFFLTLIFGATWWNKNAEIRASIYYSTIMHVTAEKAFSGIASSEGINSWFTAESEIQLKPNGRMWLRWEDFGGEEQSLDAECRVVDFSEGKFFHFAWKTHRDDYETQVHISFEPHKKGTKVIVREDGYRTGGLASMLNCAGGWGEALTLWKYSLEHDSK